MRMSTAGAPVVAGERRYAGEGEARGGRRCVGRRLGMVDWIGESSNRSSALSCRMTRPIGRCQM
jgi:hypothetical protein